MTMNWPGVRIKKVILYVYIQLFLFDIIFILII